MKLVYKICCVNVAIAFVLALFFTVSTDSMDPWRAYRMSLGMFSLGGGAINTLVALVLFLARNKVWGQGYLLSAGILLLIGLVACSAYGT